MSNWSVKMDVNGKWSVDHGTIKQDVKPGYIQSDISDEKWREVVYLDGTVYRIDNPVMLIIRKGGSTHRVIDADGVVHCYVAPESGKATLRWQSKDGCPPVKF